MQFVSKKIQSLLFSVSLMAAPACFAAGLGHQLTEQEFETSVSEAIGMKEYAKLVVEASKMLMLRNATEAQRGEGIFHSLSNKAYQCIEESNYAEAIEIAICIFQAKHPFFTGLDYATGIFEKLFEYGQGYEQAIDVAICMTESIQFPGSYRKFAGSYLFYECLIPKGIGLESAAQVATELAESGYDIDLEIAQEIFDALVQQGQPYQAQLTKVKNIRYGTID